ncbi:MAG: YdcF family protein [Alkalispirochaeta sp.]
MITKFIEPWVLVPGILVWTVGVVGIVLLLLWRRGRSVFVEGSTYGATDLSRLLRRVLRGYLVTGIFLITVSLGIYLWSIPAMERLLLGGLEDDGRGGPPSALRTVDAVVVLGGGIVDNPPSEVLIADIRYGSTREDRTTRRRGALAAEAESRLVYGYRLARTLGVPIVVTGGRVMRDETVPSEAETARLLLVELGFPSEEILIEDESRTTGENAIYTRERFGFDEVAVVTSAYHMRRALFAFDAAGLTAVPAPAPYRTDEEPLRPIDFLPSASAFYGNSIWLRERVGLAWYRIRY